MSRSNSDSVFWGIVIILIGVIFFARNMEWTDLNIWELLGTYWPLILVYIGSKNIILYFKNKK